MGWKQAGNGRVGEGKDKTGWECRGKEGGKGKTKALNGKETGKEREGQVDGEGDERNCEEEKGRRKSQGECFKANVSRRMFKGESYR